MAEVMKFDDFKNEGSEAAVKVNIYIYIYISLIECIITMRWIYFNAPCSLLLYNRLPGNIDSKDAIMSSRMEI